VIGPGGTVELGVTEAENPAVGGDEPITLAVGGDRTGRRSSADGGDILDAIWAPPWSVSAAVCCATRDWGNAPGRVPRLAESNAERERCPCRS